MPAYNRQTSSAALRASPGVCPQALWSAPAWAARMSQATLICLHALLADLSLGRVVRQVRMPRV